EGCLRQRAVGFFGRNILCLRRLGFLRLPVWFTFLRFAVSVLGETDGPQSPAFHLAKRLLSATRLKPSFGDGAVNLQRFVLKRGHLVWVRHRLTAAPGRVSSVAKPSNDSFFVLRATSLAVVTLNTSSTVVMPIRTRRQPSSASVHIPVRRAASRIWSVEAVFRINRRISSSLSIHSKIACRP